MAVGQGNSFILVSTGVRMLISASSKVVNWAKAQRGRNLIEVTGVIYYTYYNIQGILKVPVGIIF